MVKHRSTGIWGIALFGVLAILLASAFKWGF